MANYLNITKQLAKRYIRFMERSPMRALYDDIWEKNLYYKPTQHFHINMKMYKFDVSFRNKKSNELKTSVSSFCEFK